jgi:hypothetical protein
MWMKLLILAWFMGTVGLGGCMVNPPEEGKRTAPSGSDQSEEGSNTHSSRPSEGSDN